MLTVNVSVDHQEKTFSFIEEKNVNVLMCVCVSAWLYHVYRYSKGFSVKSIILPFISEGEKPDMDRNPPILNHNSRGRSTSSCNCGRKQAPREDPFDIQAANCDFYQVRVHSRLIDSSRRRSELLLLCFLELAPGSPPVRRCTSS